jgi:hypothetical protein
VCLDDQSVMDGMDLFAEIGMKEDDIATMLLGKKVSQLEEDEFDGSKGERRVRVDSISHNVLIRGVPKLWVVGPTMQHPI